MEILSRAVGRRKEAVAQVQIIRGTGQFIINNTPAEQYLQNNTCTMISVKAPMYALSTNQETVKQESTATVDFSALDTIVKVKGGGLIGQAEAIKLGLARALCLLNNNVSAVFLHCASQQESSENSAEPAKEIRKVLKDKGYLTQDSRVKERRKYGLKKARKASQYHKR